MKIQRIVMCAAFVTMTALAGLVAATPSMSAVVRSCTPTFTPNPLKVGSDFHLNITGFDPGETFTQHELVVSGDSTGATSDTDYKADASGNFDLPGFTIPLVQDHSVWRFTWTGKTSGTTCTQDVSVGESATTTTTGAPATTTTGAPATTTTAPAVAAAAVKAAPAFTG